MTLDIFRSGYAVLQDELAEEKASALGRLGRRLENALAALAACPGEESDRDTRRRLVDQAGYALWLFVVQRESCGMRDTAHLMRQYGVPREVFVRMGPLASQKPAKSGQMF